MTRYHDTAQLHGICHIETLLSLHQPLFTGPHSESPVGSGRSSLVLLHSCYTHCSTHAPLEFAGVLGFEIVVDAEDVRGSRKVKSVVFKGVTMEGLTGGLQRGNVMKPGVSEVHEKRLFMGRVDEKIA